ncbi:MAG TPA: DNA mismatch repair protein MutS [Vitreimonas sp.]|nr:DNA mismatch repair protein MutS [Vitreimonas sp.]
MSAELDFSTPMMQQYLELKKQYPDCLLFFRLGDFYELFLDDAKVGAEVLGIVLTGRSRGKDGRIPMAGVPYHAVDGYLAKLIKAGHKVAICEQTSQPDGRTLVTREVVRIVTPGTVLDEKTLVSKDHNYLLSVEVVAKKMGVAVTDLSTGEIWAGEFLADSVIARQELLQQLMVRFHPSECLISPATEAITQELATFFSGYSRVVITRHDQWPQWIRSAASVIKKQYPVLGASHPLSSNSAGSKATAGLLKYLEYTQKMMVKHLQSIQELRTDNYLHMDRSTVANLELTTNLRGDKDGSLVSLLDRTRTGAGGRLLKKWVLQPLLDETKINQRLDAVEVLVKNKVIRIEIRELLQQTSDIERILARLSTNQGSPKDLKNIEYTLINSLKVVATLQPFIKHSAVFKNLSEVKLNKKINKIITLINQSINEDPPFDPRQGDVIRSGIHKDIDHLRSILLTNREWIAQMEQQERAKTGISSLKIRFNQVFGFYIEVSKANLNLVPDSYYRKQTLVNAERFTTPELKEHETIILEAEEKINALEFALFTEMVDSILSQAALLQTWAHLLAEVDCFQALASVATEAKYTRPTLISDRRISITNGRHPVVEALKGAHHYVPNSIELAAETQQFMMITGPNMAGKSVLMRQVALIVIMAHLGSFVPAEDAKIPLTDQIFVRSGAADMITAGLSTFMVEMVETAYILRHATERSLVIMDEIGRGTSTYDGISIAWAVAESLAQAGGPLTLFATHYHELQALADEIPNQIKNYHMAITEQDQQPVFLYRLTPGGASHSFGIAVAQLAGVPASVVNRAQELLQELTYHAPQPRALSQSGEAVVKPVTAVVESPFVSPTPIVTMLREISLEQTTPLEALNILATLKQHLNS